MKSRVNVNGDAVALGHAIGSSGSYSDDTAVCIETPEPEAGRCDALLGGGNGVALAVERL